ncbi:hypothetical protein [Pseudomonas sp. F01002]|uniref:hypothetical protein n=1 Tax=Pseudomonas sp. F01002 TaxID=2555724 RepID=UPI00106BB29A|nr:hypothetical protein [Pseudomonas sp. F01002]TFB41055.1 hypothetical protein E3W21_13710 [Pseudomonas sp. F01002]
MNYRHLTPSMSLLLAFEAARNSHWAALLRALQGFTVAEVKLISLQLVWAMAKFCCRAKGENCRSELARDSPEIAAFPLVKTRFR